MVSASRAPGPISLWPRGRDADVVDVVGRQPQLSLGVLQTRDRELRLALSRRQEALRPEPHHDDQDHAEDQEVVLSRVGERRCDVADALADIRQQGLVHVRQREGAEDGAPDVPDAAEDDHDQDQDRDREREEVGRRGAEVGRLERPGDTGEAGAQREREQLRPDGVDAHHLGRRLVLAEGSPGAADPRVLEVAGDEDRDRQHEQPEVDREGSRARVEDEVEAGQEGRVDRIDALDAACPVLRSGAGC